MSFLIVDIGSQKDTEALGSRL